MNIVDQAWEILRKVSPDLILESFMQKLKPIFEEYKHLSNDNLVTKMLESIKNDKLFGETIAEAAKIALENQISLDQAVKEFESSDNNLVEQEDEQLQKQEQLPL
ncbi:MAG TPA: hypothetical protein V6D25_29745 [Leptolyngbyaceae cyanobacterium]